jgi:hypothetical protein
MDEVIKKHFLIAAIMLTVAAVCGFATRFSQKLVYEEIEKKNLFCLSVWYVEKD